jgi:hypothetical protein
MPNTLQFLLELLSKYTSKWVFVAIKANSFIRIALSSKEISYV